MSLIIDCIENIGFDVVKDRIKSVDEEKAIRTRLSLEIRNFTRTK